MRLKITFICIALFAAALAVGCGSGGSSGSSGGGTGASATESSQSTTGPETGAGGDSSSGGEAAGGAPLTKIEYLKKGDEICAKVPQEYSAELKAMEEEAKKKKQPKPTKAETNSKAAVPPLYVAIAAFEELTPPKGEEKQVEAIIAALESAAKGLEKKPESELSGPKSPFAEFQKLTEAYGFKGCSQL